MKILESFYGGIKKLFAQPKESVVSLVSNRNTWYAFSILAVFILLLAPHFAHADLLGIGNFATKAMAKVVGWIMYAIATVFGVAISIEGWFVTVMLQMGSQVANSIVVQSGYAVTLSIANLGFVLAIVIIAIATILRMESYAMKQTLWKLVVAALLVNFSLVIASAILNVADNLTVYFVNTVTSGEGNASFATKISTVFSQQNLYLAHLNQSENATSTAFEVGESVGDQMQWITKIVFVVFMLLLMVVVLGVFVFMLLMRYLYLTMLLILMPFAWLFWIFPGTKQHWSKWWHNFINWTIFAPVVVFFMWLVIQTGAAMRSNLSSSPIGGVPAFGNTTGVGGFVAGAVAGIAGPILQDIVLLGLMVAGLMVSHSLGIAGASAGMSAAQKLGKSFGGYVGRKTLQGASYPARMRIKGKSVSDHATELAGRLQAKPGAGIFKRVATLGARKVAGYGALGVSRLATAGGEEQVAHYESVYAKASVDDMKAAVVKATGPELIALLKKLAKMKEIPNLNVSHKEATEKLFERFGQSKSYHDDVETSAMISRKAYEAFSKGDVDAAQKMAVEFAKTLKRQDVEKMQVNDIYSGKAKMGMSASQLDELSEVIATGIAGGAHNIVSNLVPKMKAAQVQVFSEKYERGIGNAAAIGAIPTTEVIDRSNQFQETILNNTRGFTPTSSAPTPPPTP